MFANKFLFMGFALAALLGFACINLFLENSRLEGVNSVLLKDLENVKEKNERLTKDYNYSQKQSKCLRYSSCFTKRSYKGCYGKDRRYPVKRGRENKENLRQR